MRPTAAYNGTQRRGQWHANSNMLGISSQAQGARHAPIGRDTAIQRGAEELRGGFDRSAPFGANPQIIGAQ
jgi:hypothetical protein